MVARESAAEEKEPHAQRAECGAGIRKDHHLQRGASDVTQLTQNAKDIRLHKSEATATFLRLYLSTTAPAKGEIKMEGISEKKVICTRRRERLWDCIYCTSANCVTEPVDSYVQMRRANLARSISDSAAISANKNVLGHVGCNEGDELRSPKRHEGA